MKPASLLGIANKASLDKGHRFRNLFGLLNVWFLGWCWQFVNLKAASGIDRISAREYKANLWENIKGLAEAVRNLSYRARMVLRKYIPKLNGKLRPLGIPAIADKLLQIAVSKILEAIFEQDFLACSYGYRPGKGVLDAVRDLSAALRSGQYHYIVEADIKGFFDNIDHDLLMEMLEKRIDDKKFLRLIRKWLKAGILDIDGQVINPETGTPQGGIVSPILANIYLHYVLDIWVEEVVKTHCKGAVYLCRYADDFVCAFEYESDAVRYYEALRLRLEKYGLETAEEKTNLLLFSFKDGKNSRTFEFLGFQFRLAKGRWGKLVLKRRTARKKFRATMQSYQEWFEKNHHLPKYTFFKKLNEKLRGYYNHYGVRGNYKSLHDLLYHITRILFKVLNRRSQRKSYSWKGFKALLADFKLLQPRICRNF